MSSFLQLPRLSLGEQITCLLLCILLSRSYTHTTCRRSILVTFLCLYQYPGLGSYHCFSFHCLNPLALAPTCVVSAPRLPHLHWCNGVLGTTLPGHKLVTKGRRGEDGAAGEQHRGRGQLKEDMVCHLEINRHLSSES